jgi:hypothetical protein
VIGAHVLPAHDIAFKRGFHWLSSAASVEEPVDGDVHARGDDTAHNDESTSDDGDVSIQVRGDLVERELSHRGTSRKRGRAQPIGGVGELLESPPFGWWRLGLPC